MNIYHLTYCQPYSVAKVGGVMEKKVIRLVFSDDHSAKLWASMIMPANYQEFISRRQLRHAVPIELRTESGELIWEREQDGHPSPSVRSCFA